MIYEVTACPQCAAEVMEHCRDEAGALRHPHDARLVASIRADHDPRGGGFPFRRLTP